MVSAAYFVEKVAAEHHEELAAIPLDAAVDALNKRNAAARQMFSEATNWNSEYMDQSQRALVIISAVCTVGGCYIVQLFPEACFITFDITDSIETDLDGSAFNLVKHLGKFAFGLFLTGTIALWVFNKRVACQIHAKVAKDDTENPVTDLTLPKRQAKAIV
jgi:hypothetical protein